MTPTEQIMSAYDWARSVRDSKKSGMMLLYCACQVRKAIDENDQADLALVAIGELLAEWKRRQLDCRRRKEPCKPLDKAVIVISAILEVEQPADA
jgi:hypothetical protein